MSEDFVNVRLNQFGERYLQETGGGPLRVHEGGRVGSEFSFVPGETQRVTRAVDWDKVLKNQHINGQPLFEIVEDEADATVEQTSEVNS